MKTPMLAVFFIFVTLKVSAQQGTELSPTERDQLRATITQQMQNSVATPPSNNTINPVAPAAVDATEIPENSSATQPPQAVMTASKGESRIKSPFMLPDELFFRFKTKKENDKINTPDANAIDETAEPRLRWPLREYTLVGVIWNVKKPRAFVQDKNGKVHSYGLKDLIGNAQGYVAEINNGEVIVVERGAEFKLKLRANSAL